MNIGIEQGLAGVPSGTADARKGLMQRRQEYLAKVNADEIAGLIPTRKSLYAERYTASGTIAVNTEFQFGHKGIGDPQANLGWSGLANDVLSINETNFLVDGTIPLGELFACYGVSFEFMDNVATADIRAMSRWQVRWSEAQGTETLELGTIQEMPRVFGLALEYGYGADDETATDRNVRLVGPPYLHKEPLWITRGLSSRADQGQLIVKVPKAYSLSANTTWRARFHGIWYQKVRR